MQTPEETLFNFPCEFPIKAMGLASEHFDALVVSIVRRHAGDIAEGAVTTRASSGGKYLAVTVTIQASSRAQLDAIYHDLVAAEQVLMAF
ncbi:MAG: DUF493 domain-containing protein [Pseudomonadota bacterium]